MRTATCGAQTRRQKATEARSANEQLGTTLPSPEQGCTTAYGAKTAQSWRPHTAGSAETTESFGHQRRPQNRSRTAERCKASVRWPHKAPSTSQNRAVPGFAPKSTEGRSEL